MVVRYWASPQPTRTQRRTVDPSLIGHIANHLPSSACTPFDEASNIRMALDASKEATFCSVLPQHDVQLPRVIEDVFVVGLGCERCVQKACSGADAKASRLADIKDHKGGKKQPSVPSSALMRLRSSSHSRIWSCTVTGSRGFCRTRAAN